MSGGRGDTPHDLPLLLPLQTEGSPSPWPPSVPSVGPRAEQLELPGASRDRGLARPLRASVSPSVTRKTVLPPACAGCEDSVRENHFTSTAGHQLTHGDHDPHQELVLLTHVLKDDLTAQATMMKSHSPGSLDSLILCLQAWRLDSQTRVRAALVLRRPPPGRADGRPLPVSSQGRPCECVCVLTASSYQDPSPVGLKSTLVTAFYLNYLSKDRISKYIHVLSN